MQQYDLLKAPLILALSAYYSKTSSVTPHFYYRIVIGMMRCNFFAKFKKILQWAFRATLNSRTVKVALNIYMRLKLKLRVFLACHVVGMVTYCTPKLTATCSPMIGQFGDTTSLASTDN